ncbi:Oligoxyloglucan reducing end-specific cellobiohydrolase [Clavulina sp. PMI_390]|nr:Oligoxyloglucan reducing end-specific cellobiohydrolase [Clavulina sp. PMI_390]
MKVSLASAIGVLASATSALAVLTQTYTWKNVKIGGGGGFIPGIVFNPGQKGIAYARADIVSLYRLNYANDTWTPLLDFANDTTWDYWGIDALAVDPQSATRVYVASGMYTNSWDPNNGRILASSDSGNTWTASQLSFKVGGNMPGRGQGERLAVDPNLGSVLLYGARTGNGLWKSTNYGASWTHITTLPNVGTYIIDPSDSTGYESTAVGIAFVTYDSTSSTSGTATPHIFVGVDSNGTSNIFESKDGGSSWSAVAGQQTKYFPHKGVLSPSEKVLYVSYSDGLGPYDGTAGALYKYNLTSTTWTEISPVTVAGGAYYGYGGVAVDLQKPGTIMVAALNSWWPQGIIFRSNNSGATWSRIWDWVSYRTSSFPCTSDEAAKPYVIIAEMVNYYGLDTSLAPWLGGPIDPNNSAQLGVNRIGWMMEALVIDPFDSNHWLYGTGATIFGSHDLLRWDTVHNVTLKSLADGIEETAILDLISPPSGPLLVSAVGDIGGFVHNSLTTATTAFGLTSWATTTGVDYAGLNPTNFVRVGNTASTTELQMAISTDSGATWNYYYGAAYNVYGGHVAYSASAITILWSTASNGVMVSKYSASFSTVSTLPATSVIASDKKNDTVFYGGYASSFYVSTNSAVSFTVAQTFSGASSVNKIAANYATAGDVWVSTDVGLYHITNYGASISSISGWTKAWPVALGAPKTTGGYPAVYVGGYYLGVGGYFRSDDGGVNWYQINDSTHGFGSIASNVLAADPRTYGQVYLGTNGRGISVGTILGSAPSGTASATSTTATTTAKTTTTTSSNTSKATTTTTTTATTKASSTSTKTSTSATSTATGTVPQYGQCGGIGYTGATTCASPYTCTYENDYYYQCL